MPKVYLTDKQKDDLKVFLDKNCRSVWLHSGATNLDELKERVKGYYLRREQKDFGKIVQKTVKLLEYELTDTQRVEYEKEYDAALASMVWPTEQEIRQQCIKVQYKAKLELIDIEQAISGKVVHLAKTLKDWEWKTIREYINSIENRIKSYDPDAVAHRMVGTASSIEFCKPNNSNLADSYYYTHIMELINK